MIFLENRIGRLADELKQLSYPVSVVVEGFRMARLARKPRNINDLDIVGWEEMSGQKTWSGHREYFWFDGEVTIPESIVGKCAVFELTTGTENDWDATNPQFSVYIDGRLAQGFDSNHHSVVLTEQAKDGSRYRLNLLAYTGEKFVTMRFMPVLRALDRLTEKYFFDVSVPCQAARLMDRQDQAYIDIIKTLNDSLNLLDLRKPGSESYYESLSRAQTHLADHFYGRLCGRESPVVSCVGHTHIDVAWLWTLGVTRDKAVRSFSTVLRLMDEYPEYVFMSSQPQLYKFIREDAPEVFEKIRSRVREGRWEADGAMFLEADCNIASGEALVRQILMGTRFFRDEFGVDNKILWLPDVFGYSAALPQILKLSGIPYFMTTKISWNEFNKLPYDTFEWAGIDGTRVLTHFSPSRDFLAPHQHNDRENQHYTTYNARLTPSQVIGCWQRYQQKHLNNEVLMSFGHGDGGGGPTREMLENQRRLSFGIPGCPRTKMATAREFFEHLDEDVRGSKYLPVWHGELYLELHRGTYTTMARNKKYNRRAEFAWQNVEFFCALAAVYGKAAYPADEIREGWEVVLRNQFHDILPGSSIKEVYDESREEYETLAIKSEAIQNNAIAGLISSLGGTVMPADRSASGSADGAASDHAADAADSLVVFNPNGLTVDGPLTFPGTAADGRPVLLADDGSATVCQRGFDGDWLACMPDIPPKGWRKFQLADEASCGAGYNGNELSASPDHLSNAFLDIRLNDKGQFISIYDKKSCRELLPADSRANVLMSYEDKPHQYDAWDINHYYREKSWEVDDVQSIRVIESGPVRAGLEIRRRYLDSDIAQMIFIWRGQNRIDIRHEIDWREKQILLKALFPVDINSRRATFDIQYGNVERNTHSNTSWDFARFEVCMHKWLDISEDNFGVSILNDCKYGVSVRDGEIGLSLLKSAVWPNPEADKEHHTFVFSILPHDGDWRQAGTVRKAYALNNPLVAVPAALDGGAFPSRFSFVRSDQENVVVEVLKQAEDSADWVIRLYECYNRQTRVRLSFAWPASRACGCDLLENDQEDLATADKGRALDLVLRPYEIRTIKARFV